VQNFYLLPIRLQVTTLKVVTNGKVKKPYVLSAAFTECVFGLLLTFLAA
jgi:hypothetical protein